MSAPDRPHCLTLTACTAAGKGHCRRCAGVRAGKVRAADPAFRAASRTRLIAINKDPEIRRRVVATMLSKPGAAERLKADGRRAAAACHGDPDAERRRLAASAAAQPARTATIARRLARSVDIPLSLVPDYRVMRLAKVPVEDIRAALVRAHPGAFAQHYASRRAEAARAAGPIPAIGTPQRAAWTRRVNATAEARPC